VIYIAYVDKLFA